MTDHPDLTTLLAHRRQPDPAVAAHLGGCEGCQLRAAQLEGEVSAILDPEPPPMTDREVDALLARVLDRPIRTGRPWVRIGAWAIAALVLFSTGVFAMMAVQALQKPPPPPVEAPAVPPTAAAPSPRRAPAPRLPEPARVAPSPDLSPAAAPEPEPPPAPEPPRRRSLEDDTLFQDAAAALARGDTVTAKVLIEVLVALHPDNDVGALLLTERGLSLRVSDPAAAANSFRAALGQDPDGPMAADLRRWLCEIAPDECP